MRKKLIAGNWKMNCLKTEGIALVQGIADEIAKGGKSAQRAQLCIASGFAPEEALPKA